MTDYNVCIHFRPRLMLAALSFQEEKSETTSVNTGIFFLPLTTLLITLTNTCRWNQIQRGYRLLSESQAIFFAQ